MPAMRCNEVVISIALVLRREAAETEQMSHRGHSPVALRERRTVWQIICRPEFYEKLKQHINQ